MGKMIRYAHAIGISGFVMWISELLSYVMPEWMINIMHLAHSEEAFPAAVFIFTIHFFNNHIVPDKFPFKKTCPRAPTPSRH